MSSPVFRHQLCLNAAKFWLIYLLMAVEFFRVFSTTFTYFVSKKRRYLLILWRLKVCVWLFEYHYDCTLVDVVVVWCSDAHWLLQKQLTKTIFICPIAIAYNMGQIIKSVASVCVCVCVSVCPCVVTLTVAFLYRFSPNLTQRCKPPKVRTSSLGVNIAPPLPYFTHKNPHFWSRSWKSMQIWKTQYLP